MVLSDISIKRPVFATVISLMLIVLGLASLYKMPIREYPKIDPPIIQIITTYRGASAPVVDNQITEILEGAVAGIEGIKAIQSQSRDERSQITLEFRLTRDVDSAANDVRDRVARALARLSAHPREQLVVYVWPFSQRSSHVCLSLWRSAVRAPSGPDDSCAGE